MKFGYARVSTNEQNLNLQLDALTKYGVDEIYQEKVSGTKPNRKELTDLLGKLRKGDTLVIWRLDRLGRTVNQLLSLAEDFQSKGISFVSITENFDTVTPTGKFVFHMFCAMAQMERDIIAERTKSGLESARARGRVGGRPPVNKTALKTALTMYSSHQYTIKEIVKVTGISQGTLYKAVNMQKE